MFVLWIAHRILNKKWYGHLFQGKYTPVRMLQTAAYFAVLLSSLGLMVSGIILSREVFAFLWISCFDVAYTYHGYHAEKAARKTLTERYPREDFLLAAKMPLRDIRDGQDMETIFQEQLEHCGVRFFGCYFLHNMGYNVYAKCCRHHAFGFVQRKKEEGKIKGTGIFFHGTMGLLEGIS